MAYEASVAVDFSCGREVVYGALSYLGRHPEWNQGMIYISHTGPMFPGLRYETRTRVLGQINAAEIEVVNLIANTTVKLRSNTGLISYDATYRLKDRDDGGSVVTCDLTFEFNNVVLNLARGAIESMARERLERDLRKLAEILGEQSGR